MASISPSPPIRDESSIGATPQIDGVCHIRKSLQTRGFSEETVQIIYQGWSSNTIKQYKTYIKKWIHFCKSRNLDENSSSVINILDFFTDLFQNGSSFSAVNTAKAALLTFVKVNDSASWKDDPAVTKFFSGCFKIRTPLPKYTSTWNVELVLEYLDMFMPLDQVSLKELTLKAVALVTLASGSRAQTIHLMNINNMVIESNTIRFFFDSTLKSSKPGKKPHMLEFSRFTIPTRCVVHTITEYIKRTNDLRSSQQLWVSFIKPHKPVTRCTISRWLKTILIQAGIDIEQFTAHSFRMASTSKAAAAGVGLQAIMDTANWSSSINFERFYHKELLDESKKVKFAKSVLTKST